MNYIRHLNNFLRRAAADPNMTAGHISLYMAIFQQWNIIHFKDYFTANRKLLMRNGKIGSRDTYTKYLKDLHTGCYIRYYPAVDRCLPPQLTVFRMDYYHDDSTLRQMRLFKAKSFDPGDAKTGTEAVPDPDDDGPGSGTGAVPDPGHLYKQTNTKQENSVLNTPMLTEVKEFFREHGYPVLEAKKFWYYNESKHWQLADGTKIKQWEPLAHKWMLNVNTTGENKNTGSGNPADRDKNYDEPL